jgi:DNA (cytosine-5)-methyltransferase 1
MAAKRKPRNFTVVDLFSGCGGITHGLHQVEVDGARFKTLVAVDIWKSACETLKRNHPEVEVVDQGLSQKLIQLIESRYLDSGVDLVVGGPPCQGFSTSGKRALDDPRNNLVKMYLKAIAAWRPRAFLMENVVGFTTFQGGRIRNDVVGEAKKLGYDVFPAVVQASLYGVPQRRKRFVMIGVLSGDFEWPPFIDATTGKPLKGNSIQTEMFNESENALHVQEIPTGFKELSFGDATKDLPRLEAGQSRDRYKKPKNSNWFLEYVRDSSELDQLSGLTSHSSPNHADYLVEMMKGLEQGQSAFDAYEEGHELRPTSGFSNSYTRISNNAPAPTITRNFTTPSSANCIHPVDARALTPREGARMQSFPDSYEFCGTSTEQRLQIGNAVPPLLAKALGEAIMRNLFTQRE